MLGCLPKHSVRPQKVRADFACAQSGIQNHSRFPSTLGFCIFGALHWLGAYIYDSSAQKLPRALAHSNRLQHTVHRQLVRSRHQAIRVRCGVAPRRPGARLLWGTAAPCWSDPGHDGRRLAPLVAPERATPLPPLHMKRCTELPCFALETDFFQNLLTKVSNGPLFLLTLTLVSV